MGDNNLRDLYDTQLVCRDIVTTKESSKNTDVQRDDNISVNDNNKDKIGTRRSDKFEW